MFEFTTAVDCVAATGRWVVVAASALSAACTWQDTLHQASLAPEYLRLSDQVWVEHAPRWRLAPNTSLAVRTPASAPQGWTDAANSGLRRYFSTSQTHPDILLMVLWPQEPVAGQMPDPVLREQSYGATMAGGFEMPAIPATQRLTIHAIDTRGELLQRMQLRISPKLWGSSWHDPELIETAFAHLAKVLQGDQQGG